MEFIYKDGKHGVGFYDTKNPDLVFYKNQDGTFTGMIYDKNKKGTPITNIRDNVLQSLQAADPVNQPTQPAGFDYNNVFAGKDLMSAPLTINAQPYNVDSGSKTNLMSPELEAVQGRQQIGGLQMSGGQPTTAPVMQQTPPPDSPLAEAKKKKGPGPQPIEKDDTEDKNNEEIKKQYEGLSEDMTRALMPDQPFPWEIGKDPRNKVNTGIAGAVKGLLGNVYSRAKATQALKKYSDLSGREMILERPTDLIGQLNSSPGKVKFEKDPNVMTPEERFAKAKYDQQLALMQMELKKAQIYADKDKYVADRGVAKMDQYGNAISKLPSGSSIVYSKDGVSPMDIYTKGTTKK